MPTWVNAQWLPGVLCGEKLGFHQGCSGQSAEIGELCLPGWGVSAIPALGGGFLLFM